MCQVPYNYNDKWPGNYKFAYIEKVTNYLEYNPDDQNSIDDVNVNAKLTTGLTECKIEDYDHALLSIVRKLFVKSCVETGLDYQIDLIFNKRIAVKQ